MTNPIATRSNRQWLNLATIITATFVLCFIVQYVSAQESPASDSASPADPYKSDVEAIQANAAAFAKAYNAGDAKALAQLWTDDGDYVDEQGARTIGRDAIEAQYAEVFKEHPQARMALSIEAMKFLDDSTVVEDGVARMEISPLAPPMAARYVVVHVKRDGKWLISTVRDVRGGDGSNGESAESQGLEQLAWLIGRWKVSGDDATVNMTCKWLAGRKYIEREFTTVAGDKILSSGTQVIGIDPVSGRLHSWTFDSSGGRGESVWHPTDGGWVIQSNGILADGSLTTSRNIVMPVDKNTFRWQSTARHVHNISFPDSEPVEAVRIEDN